MRKIIAHRGCHHEYPENSLESLCAIKSYPNDGSFGVEFDVQKISTGELVCYHDYDLRRLHNQNKKVKDIKLDDVFLNNITLFDDVLQHFVDTNYFLNIEIKCYDWNYSEKEQVCKKVVGLVEHYGLKNCLLTSFDHEIVALLVNENILSGLIIDEDHKDFGSIKTLVISKKLAKNIDSYINSGIENIFVYTFKKMSKKEVKLLRKLRKYPNISVISDDLRKLVPFFRR